MGYTMGPGTEITDFWPDDTDTKIYIATDGGSLPLADLFSKAKEKWPNATLQNIEVSSEKIHTSCLYCDLYDAGDYTDFLILTHLY
jgi:hypothetical protein